MTAKEILNKVKAVFNATEVAEPAKFTSVTITDGQPIYFDAPEVAVGVPVFMDEAMSMPYPDGTYTADGGVTFTVAGGVVSGLAEAAQAAPVAPAVPDYSKQFDAMNNEIASLKRQHAELLQRLGVVNTQLAKHDKTIPGLFELAEKLTELPAADPQTLTARQKDSFDKANKKEARIKEFAKNIENMRK